MLAIALVIIPVSSVLAASSAGVTVTATPLFLSIENTPDTWTINGLGGGTERGVIDPGTTYYANPITDADDIIPPSETVLDTECYFTVTCVIGATTCDLTVIWGDFAGGGADMTNSGAGTNGVDIYGAHCWYGGMETYSTSKVVVKSSGSDKMYTADGLAACASLEWGVEILTQTNDWTSGTSSISTLTITATEH